MKKGDVREATPLNAKWIEQMTNTTITAKTAAVHDIFATNALKYFEMGYNVIPLLPNTKKPFQNGWQIWATTAQTESEIEEWVTKFAKFNIGIPLGEASGVIGLDFDNDVDGIHEKILAKFDGSPVKKKGEKGFTAFYRYNGEIPKKWYKDGRAIIELLSTGNQTVLPPSIHPDTKKPYYWITPDTLLDTAAKDLPCLPSDFIEQVNEMLGYTKKLASYTNKFEGQIPEISEIEKALSFIPASEYATWITVGMALHHTYGATGFPLWDNWSRTAPNYDGKIMDGKWYSFGKTQNPVAVGTIFHFAIGYGYIAHSDIALEDMPVMTFGSVPVVNIKEALTFPQKLLDNAPGLPGMIANWINSTSIRRQPILALGAAICAAGTIYAHRIRSESDLRTNFMVLGLAESGCGKEHARRCIDSLFVNIGMDNLLLGEFASDAAVISSLKNNNGIGFAMMDEIGRELKALNNKRAGGHEARILTTLMKIFSQANSTYRGKQYANHDGSMGRNDLIQPCLAIYGTTVPKRFFDALTSDDAIDGFLARWLVFETKDIRPLIQEGGSLTDIPQNIMNAVADIQTMGGVTGYSLTSMKQPEPKPTIIRFTEGAQDILNKLRNTCEENRITEIQKGSTLAAIWSRTVEHAIKLALVAHPINSGEIDARTMQWAADLGLFLSHYSLQAINDHVTDNEYEKNMQRVYNIINAHNAKNNEPMKHWKLAGAVRTIKQRECTEILNHLSQSGRIEVVETKYNDKISYSYRAL